MSGANDYPYYKGVINARQPIKGGPKYPIVEFKLDTRRRPSVSAIADAIAFSDGYDLVDRSRAHRLHLYRIKHEFQGIVPSRSYIVSFDDDGLLIVDKPKWFKWPFE